LIVKARTTSIAFSPNGVQLIGGYYNSYSEYYGQFRIRDLSHYENEAVLSSPLAYELAATPTHIVYSTDDQYMAIATVDNKIHVWRAQYNGKFKQYVQLATYTQSSITMLQFATKQATSKYETRVILLVVYSDSQKSHLHTFDILTQQEIREPVAVAFMNNSVSVILADACGMECVATAIRGSSELRVLNALSHVSAATWRFEKLLQCPVYRDAVTLFKKHPAVAFHSTRNEALLERAIAPSNDSSQADTNKRLYLLDLLDPDIAVLDGKQMDNASRSSVRAHY
jgi:hypothetical protein